MARNIGPEPEPLLILARLADLGIEIMEGTNDMEDLSLRLGMLVTGLVATGDENGGIAD